MRNFARMTALVASRDLMESLANFITSVEETRTLTNDDYTRSFRSVVDAMRTDLGVVEGDVREFVKVLMKG